MSEENETQNSEPQTTNSNIRFTVAETLAAIGKERVRQSVINKLVEDEIANRTSSALEGLNRLAKMKNDLKKLKPDQKGLDATGKIVSETYSQAKFEEKKKATEQITKLEKALELALENGDYSKLKEVSN